jgi:hypothetical protein
MQSLRRRRIPDPDEEYCPPVARVTTRIIMAKRDPKYQNP